MAKQDFLHERSQEAQKRYRMARSLFREGGVLPFHVDLGEAETAALDGELKNARSLIQSAWQGWATSGYTKGIADTLSVQATVIEMEQKADRFMDLLEISVLALIVYPFAESSTYKMNYEIASGALADLRGERDAKRQIQKMIDRIKASLGEFAILVHLPSNRQQNISRVLQSLNLINRDPHKTDFGRFPNNES
jgi:hypothetical protein